MDRRLFLRSAWPPRNGRGGPWPAAAPTSGGSGTTTVRLGDTVAESNPEVAAERWFGERLAALTKGKIEVKVFPNSTLGDANRMNEQVRQGTLQLTKTLIANLTAFDKQARHAVPAVPVRQARRTSSPRWTASSARRSSRCSRRSSSKVLAFFDSGSRNVYNTKRAIRTPADLKGLRLRVPQDPMAIDTFNTLGAQATPLAANEIYSALQQGVIDGAENNPIFYVTNKHVEEAKYWSWTRHQFGTDTLLVSLKWFDSQPEDVAGRAGPGGRGDPGARARAVEGGDGEVRHRGHRQGRQVQRRRRCRGVPAGGQAGPDQEQGQLRRAGGPLAGRLMDPSNESRPGDRPEDLPADDARPDEHRPAGEAEDPLASRPEDRPEPPEEEESGWGRTPPHQLAGPLKGVALFENTVIFGLLAAIVAVILAQVVFRRFLDDPLSWSTEIATQLLVYVAFVGFAIGVRDNSHVAMRLFEDRLGVRARAGHPGGRAGRPRAGGRADRLRRPDLRDRAGRRRHPGRLPALDRLRRPPVRLRARRPARRRGPGRAAARQGPTRGQRGGSGMSFAGGLLGILALILIGMPVVAALGAVGIALALNDDVPISIAAQATSTG